MNPTRVGAAAPARQPRKIGPGRFPHRERTASVLRTLRRTEPGLPRSPAAEPSPGRRSSSTGVENLVENPRKTEGEARPPVSELAELWSNCLALLRAQVSESVWASTFANLPIRSAD